MIKIHLTQQEIDSINNTFSYHAPKGDQQERYIAIREKAKELATLIYECQHNSRERSLAITHLQNCTMWANAGIACNE